MTDPDLTIEQPSAASDTEQLVEPTEPQLEQPEHPDHQQQPLAELPVDANAADVDATATGASQQQLPPPPLFHPLFTLVTDATTRTVHHPQVHYIFSDDNPDFLAEALAQASIRNEQRPEGSSPSGSTSNKPSRQSASPASPTPVTNERAILLDLVPKSTAPASGGDDPVATTSTAVSSMSSQYEITWASSLSGKWAVTSAKLSPMPDDDASARGDGVLDDGDAGAAQTLPQQRYMLQLEGIDANAGFVPTRDPVATANQRPRKTSGATRRPSLGDRDMRMSSGSANSGERTQPQMAVQEDYNVIVDEYSKRMAVMRKVLDVGLERQRKVNTTTTTTVTEIISNAPTKVPVLAESPLVAEDEINTQQQQLDRPQGQCLPTDRPTTQQTSSNDGGGSGAVDD